MSSTQPDSAPPEGDDFVAAEYVLGVLSLEERRAVERRIETDGPFARLVARWQQQFDGMNAEFEPVTPPQNIKTFIDRRLFGQPNQVPVSVWDSLTFWRGLAFVALALAVIGFGRDFLRQEPAPGLQMIASMAADNSPIRTIAVFDEDSRKLKVSFVAGALPPDRSLELWLIAGNEAPASLGLIQSPQVTEFNVDKPLADKLRAGTTLAISVEPVGGSPSKAPTGPVVAAGTVSGI